MSRQSLRNMFAVVAIGAAALGSTLAPTGALAFGHGGGGGGHFGGGGGAHFGGGHVTQAHFSGGHSGGNRLVSHGGGRSFSHSSSHFAHSGHGGQHHANGHPFSHHGHRFAGGHHRWGHPYGIGGDYAAGGDDYVESRPVAYAATPAPTSAPMQAAAACVKPVADASFIMVAFAPTATAADITAFLQGYKADITEGPDADGIYRIKVGDQKLSQADMENLVGSIRRQAAIIRYVAA